MLATPSPMIRPPVISGPCPSPPNPTISWPMLTTTAAISMLAIVTSTLSPMLWLGDAEPEHGDEMHAPDSRGSDGYGRQQQPADTRSALQGPGRRALVRN